MLDVHGRWRADAASKGSGDRARGGDRCGDRHGTADGERLVALVGREVAGAERAALGRGGEQDRLGDHPLRGVREAHGPAGGHAQPLEPGREGGVDEIMGGRLVARLAEIGGTDQHYRHGSVDAGDRDTVDQVDRLTSRQQRPGLSAGRIKEDEADRGSGPGHAGDGGPALVGDAAARRRDLGLDDLAGVDVVDADRRRTFVGRNEAGLDRERTYRGQDVAAVRRQVDGALPDPHLGEQR
jgi:hypothetical protein